MNSSRRRRSRWLMARRRPWVSPRRGAGIGRMASNLNNPGHRGLSPEMSACAPGPAAIGPARRRSDQLGLSPAGAFGAAGVAASFALSAAAAVAFSAPAGFGFAAPVEAVADFGAAGAPAFGAAARLRRRRSQPSARLRRGASRAGASRAAACRLRLAVVGFDAAPWRRGGRLRLRGFAAVPAFGFAAVAGSGGGRFGAVLAFGLAAVPAFGFAAVARPSASRLRLRGRRLRRVLRARLRRGLARGRAGRTRALRARRARRRERPSWSRRPAARAPGSRRWCPARRRGRRGSGRSLRTRPCVRARRRR